ncbi:hypothetical protein LXL04_006601 [Taraxacum kok-saghyz]
MGNVFNPADAALFNEMIYDTGLVEVGMMGKRFTRVDRSGVDNRQTLLDRVEEIEIDIDMGVVSADLINERQEALNKIHEMDNVEALDCM